MSIEAQVERPAEDAFFKIAMKTLHVGTPNLGDRGRFLERIERILDKKWLSNNGENVQEFERRVSQITGTKHCITVCNATVGLDVAARAMGLAGEVILPSYTFIATAHAMLWQGITPVFADIDPQTHNLDWRSVESRISSNTTGILGVHLWGRPCDITNLQNLASKYHLKIFYDAAHAFSCSRNREWVGNFGECEVFSFHATKFINCLEGGAIVTNNDDLAEKVRQMINFGFTDYDCASGLGTNGKMNEISAAMGITNLEALPKIIGKNRENYEIYKKFLRGVEGISLIAHNEEERNNYQYVVVEVDSDLPLGTRDHIVKSLHANGIIARRYFWPGCHRMEPYRSRQPQTETLLPHTEEIAGRVIVLPTGQAVDDVAIRRICEMIDHALSQSRA